MGGTFPIFSMKLTVTVRWPPRFDLAPASRQTQHQIMYPRIVPGNSADELAVRLAFAFVHVRVAYVYRVADVCVAHDTERTSGFWNKSLLNHVGKKDSSTSPWLQIVSTSACAAVLGVA